MMTKLLSLVLSFTILFTSVAPSYAQARNAQRRAGAAQPAAVEQYDDMKEHDCKRDAKGNVVAVDLSLPENEKALQEMLASADAFEWKSCAYVAGLKNYFEKNPKRARSLTAWQRNSVIFSAMEKYIKRWNANPSARENSTFRQIFIDLNAVVMKDVPDTQTAYIFRPTKNKFLRVVDPNTIEKKVEEKTSAGQADGAQSTGSIFGLPGGTGTFSGPSADLLKEVEKVYEMLTQDPSASNDSSSSLSYEEFAELYEQDVRYAYSGAMANNAQQHINKPGWSEYVAQMNQAMETELSAAKIKEAYDEYLKNLEQMDGGIQEEVQKYLQDLAAQIWEMYSADRALWLGVVQDVFPVFQMYGGLSDTVRQKAAAAMREEIRKHQDDCEKPGFFSMLTLKGLAQTVTLHQSQGAKDLVTEHVMKMNASCAYATKAATALAVLGQWGEETADSQAIQEWFKKGFNFSSSGLVIPTALSALLAMGAYDKAANMVAYAGEKSDTKETLQAVFGGLSVLEWTQLFQSGDSHWSEQVNLEYSYYEDDKGVQRNIWMDTADFLVEAYVAADAREQKRMNEFFRKSVESLITPREPFNEQLRFALRPFLVGVFTHHLVSVRLSDSDLGEVRFKAPVSVLLDLDKIVDKDNKKQIKQWFKENRKDKVPYHTLLMWYLFLSNKNDVHPEMRIAFDSRLADAIFNSTDNRAWRQEVTTLIEKEQASLSDSLDSFSSWNETKENLVPLDDLVSLFFLYQGGKGLFSLLKFVGRSIGVLSGNVVNLLRMMRSVQLGNVPQMGKNLGRMLKVGLKEFKSSSFARLKTMAIGKIRTRRNMPKFTPKPTEPTEPTMGPSAVKLPVARSFRRPKRQKLPPQRPVDVRVLNGQYYMVPKGTETFYVRGQVQFVTKGMRPVEVAKQFGVDVSEVVLAKNGSVAPKPALSLRNYSMGDGVNGATGSQPLGGRPGKPVTIHPREVAVKPQTPASLVKPGEKAALVYQSGEWRAVSVPEELTKAEIADKFKVSVDDVDYVVKFADGTFAPEWAEYSLVWDVLQSPAPSSTALNLTRWQWMKLNAAVTFDIFTNNLRDLVSFPWRNPVRAAGMAGSSFGLGGVAPVAFYAEAPATASQVVSFGETSARFLSATRTAETAGAVSTATTAGAEMAGATRTATQLGSGWFNLFWGARAVTDPWFLTPVGALPSAGTRWNGKISKWELSDTYKKYRAQLNKWLFASSALQRQHNPWFLRDTWIDLTNSAILGYKEWRMSLAGNSAYLSSLKSTLNFIPETVNETARFTARFIVTPDGTVIDRHNTSEADAAAAIADPDEETTPDLERQENEAATTNGASSSSGILYSGIPVMAIADLTKDVISWAKRVYARVAAVFSPQLGTPKEIRQAGSTNNAVVDGEKVVYTYQRIAYNPATRDFEILSDEGALPKRLEGWSVYLMAKKYFFMPKAGSKTPEEIADNKVDNDMDPAFLFATPLAELVLQQKTPSRNQLLWVLASGASQVAKLQAYKRMQELNYALPSPVEVIEMAVKIQEAMKTVTLTAEEKLNIRDFILRLVNEGVSLPQMAGSERSAVGETGVLDDILLGKDLDKISSVLHDAKDLNRFLAQMKVTTTFNGHKKYSGLLPIYLRLADKTLSAGPRLYLVLGKGVSYTVPRGFVIAMDEKGQFKYVEQASESEIVNGSRLPLKFMDRSVRLLKTAVSKRPHLVFEQVFSVAELQGLSMLLAQDTKGQKVGILNVRPQDSFEGLMQIIAGIAGADLGASMAGEFKAMFPLAFVSALIAGFGYLSPLIANLFKGVVAKAGDFKVIRTLLWVVMGLSFVGMLAGLYGTFVLADASPFAAALSYIFAPINIIVASVLSTIASPIMKSAYPDPTQYASKNMGFTTTKGLSRFVVTIFPWMASVLVGAVLGKTVNLNWSLLVPVMLGVSVLAYYRLMHSRLASNDLSSAKKQKSISKEKAEQIYRDVFKEKLAPNVMRVALVYLTYGVINSVMLSSEMKLLYPDGGLSITGAGLLLSYFVRKLADSMIKNKIISDDQLTGIGIPLMVGGVLFYAIFPAASLGMWLAWVAMYLSTPVFGVVENSRMQNAVALHYEREREKIRADERLTEAERKNKIGDINAEERGVKNEATAVYNKANAMGAVSIALLVLLSGFLQDWSVTAEMGKPMLDFINSLFGDTASSENLQSTFAVMAEKYGALFADKQDSLLTSLSLYRLGTLLPMVTAGILLYKNWDLVKEGWWNRALRSIAFSQEDIARLNKGEMTQEEVYDRLHVEPKHAEALVDRVVSEMKTIQESVRGSVHALESEARLQSLMNRMVWLNNRIKVLMSLGKTDKLISALYALRATASLLEKALEQNDVSQALRTQAKELLASVNSVSFEEDIQVDNLASLMIEQMQHLPQTKRDAFEYEVEAMVEAYRQGDLARFQLHYRNAKRMVPLSKIPAGVDEQIKGAYKEISQTMETRKYTLQTTEGSSLLNYQPESQVSLIGNLPYLAQEAKEIFDGTDVKNYEKAKVRYLRSLKILLDKKNAGNGYDGIERDFEEYYQKAVATLALYLEEHPDDVERVKALFNDMNEVYVQFMGEDPVLQAERKLNDAIEAAMADFAAVGQQETVALQKLMAEMQKAGAQQEGPAAQPLGLEDMRALFIAPLEQALKLKQPGQPVDEVAQSGIADFYQRADQAMTQYLNAHPKEDAEVVAMHKKLDELYTQIIGEAPTKEKVAELAKKSSGLMSMVDWFGQLLEELLAWFKDGDDSPGANDGSGDLSALPSPGGGAIQLARLPGKKEVDAVIFDMDGTLLNTLGAWKNSTSNFLRSRGIEPPENIDAEMAALSLLEGARVLKERYGFKESPEELLEEVLATVRKFYEEDAMPKPGVPGVLQALKKQGIKICVATASDRKFAEAAFKRTGLMEYIDFIITCDEVGVGKHNPLVYETALKKLGTDRKRTLVVEDALYALQTAKKAGFPTAGVYEVDFAADQSALQSDATYYVPSFQTVVVGN